MAAVTPKGERRRYALISAAAELLCEGGFDAVRHRAVATRAGLPLASTTYYFASLDELIAAAVEHLGMLEVAQLRARCAALPRRRRGAETIADLLVELLLGAGTGGVAGVDPTVDADADAAADADADADAGTDAASAADADGPAAAEQMISRYERYIACARLATLRDIQRRVLHQRCDAVADVVERSGRLARVEALDALVCMVDGAAMAALVDDARDPQAAVRATLVGVIDMLAPLDRRAVSA